MGKTHNANCNHFTGKKKKIRVRKKVFKPKRTHVNKYAKYSILERSDLNV